MCLQTARERENARKPASLTLPPFSPFTVAFLFTKVKGDDAAVKELHNLMYRRPGKVRRERDGIKTP